MIHVTELAELIVATEQFNESRREISHESIRKALKLLRQPEELFEFILRMESCWGNQLEWAERYLNKNEFSQKKMKTMLRRIENSVNHSSESSQSDE